MSGTHGYQRTRERLGKGRQSAIETCTSVAPTESLSWSSRRCCASRRVAAPSVAPRIQEADLSTSTVGSSITVTRLDESEDCSATLATDTYWLERETTYRYFVQPSFTLNARVDPDNRLSVRPEVVIEHLAEHDPVCKQLLKLWDEQHPMPIGENA